MVYLPYMATLTPAVFSRDAPGRWQCFKAAKLADTQLGVNTFAAPGGAEDPAHLGADPEKSTAASSCKRTPK